MRSYPLARVAIGVLIGWAVWMPFGRLPWYAYPTLWIAVGLFIGEALLRARPTEERKER